MARLEDIVANLIDKTREGALQWKPSDIGHPTWVCELGQNRTFRVTNIFSDPKGFTLYLDWFNNKVFMCESLGRGEHVQPLV